jgi:hypothetical protein
MSVRLGTGFASVTTTNAAACKANSAPFCALMLSLTKYCFTSGYTKCLYAEFMYIFSHTTCFDRHDHLQGGHKARQNWRKIEV